MVLPGRRDSVAIWAEILGNEKERKVSETKRKWDLFQMCKYLVSTMRKKKQDDMQFTVCRQLNPNNFIYKDEYAFVE